MAGMAVFYVAGHLIEEKRSWPVITASPQGQCSNVYCVKKHAAY